MRQALFDSAIKFWLDMGVDGFRIDTVNRISKDPRYPDVRPAKVAGRLQPGSEFYINGLKMHQYLKDVRRFMDEHAPGQELLLVGELPRTSFEEMKRYVAPCERELSMVFDFDMVKLGNNDNPDEFAPHQVSNLCDRDPSFTLPLFKRALMKVQSLISDHGAWGTLFMECHDQPRSITRYASADPRYWRQSGKLLAMLQTTLSGTLFVYNGQEIGMQNM